MSAGAARRVAWVALAACLFGVARGASEPQESVPLADGPGRDLVEGRCALCHSLEYIPANRPAMNAAGWQKTVQKMREKFGAPLTDAEVQAILAYLDAHYAGKT